MFALLNFALLLYPDNKVMPNKILSIYRNSCNTLSFHDSNVCLLTQILPQPYRCNFNQYLTSYHFIYLVKG